MNRFIPVSSSLRKRLARTSYDKMQEFRQLLLLERLVQRPLSAWPAEAMFIGLRAVPGRNQDADSRVRVLGAAPG
jgi:hypothetical protein